MSYYGRIVTARPKNFIGQAEDYICIGQIGSGLTLIEADGGSYRSFAAIDWEVTGDRAPQGEVDKLIARLRSYLRLADKGLLDETKTVAHARLVLEELNKIQKLREQKKADKSDLFGLLYGGGSPVSLIGKLIFMEQSDDFGEFVIVEESQDAMYGVSTDDVSEATVVYQLPRNNTKVIRSYCDDEFVMGLVERLKKFSTERVASPVYSLGDMVDNGPFTLEGQYETGTYDGALTTARQLERAIKHREQHSRLTDEAIRSLMGRFNSRGAQTSRMSGANGLNQSGLYPNHAPAGATGCCGGPIGAK